MTARLVYRNAEGQVLTTDDLVGFTGRVSWEIIGDEHVPDEARRLHQQGREAGAQGDHERALALLDQAHALAPSWPYPRYDAAFTAFAERADHSGGLGNPVNPLFVCWLDPFGQAQRSWTPYR